MALILRMAEDQVYLEDESCKKEYIMADSGLIWRGSHKQMRPCPWHFAQFEKNILQCSLYLLNQVGKLSVAGRADPVRVARVISAAVSPSIIQNMKLYVKYAPCKYLPLPSFFR